MSMRVLSYLFAAIIMQGVAPNVYAGSDRWIMTMNEGRMESEDLVFVQIFNPAGIPLESDALTQLTVREQDCNTGKLLEVSTHYKLGYSPKHMQVGVYLPHLTWSNKTLCFSLQNFGKAEQKFDPVSNKGRLFQLKIVR